MVESGRVMDDDGEASRRQDEDRTDLFTGEKSSDLTTSNLSKPSDTV